MEHYVTVKNMELHVYVLIWKFSMKLNEKACFSLILGVCECVHLYKGISMVSSLSKGHKTKL